eukprot:TRINITY_DN4073_c0_g1_i2.p1 TRINITY_DN4073_c0_g1~~TRINITY_DN4073_c0_g1_i2.p1  ORF type:complete len:104 (-),score=19.38 TRINITY_DN4073_c0_g1_i2:19-330(-)
MQPSVGITDSTSSNNNLLLNEAYNYDVFDPTLGMISADFWIDSNNSCQIDMLAELKENLTPATTAGNQHEEKQTSQGQTEIDSDPVLDWIEALAVQSPTSDTD